MFLESVLFEFPINSVHFLLALSKLELISRDSHLEFKHLDSFADIFVFLEEFLVMASALRTRPRAYECRQFIVEVHLSE